MQTNTKIKSIETKTTIGRSGQTTFPAKIMKELGLKEGDQLRFSLHPDGVITVEPVQLLSAEQLFGIFDQSQDQDGFVLNLDSAREERSEQILAKNHFGGE
ncbi:AbrB/MazE/SpoVT family DNA-binding domain-containing protein [Paenibacillus wenxiniae]|uniref:AbrB/MazE/SpoVT family DNA-binding domain-containing protein n=1 Tax=Paenibacillus wenxiniae TaxID=1636843 RepID=A0ABW4RJC2_9BACL